MDDEALPASLYRDTARPAVPTPPLDRDRRVDVAVIGGGFTGLSAALHLAERGVSVAVLEAHEPGWGASGRNGGQVNPGLKAEPDQIEKDLGPDLGGRMVALSGGAPDAVFGLIRQHGIDCEANQCGTLRAAFSNGDAEVIRRTADTWAARAMPVRYLDRAEMEAATGTTRYINGVLDRRGGTLNPLSYSRGLAAAAIKAGAGIYGRTRAIAARPNGPGWNITTPGGRVQADWLILATNGYTDDLWPRLRRSIVPVFSGIVASEPLGRELLARVLPLRPAVYEIGSITTYYRVDESGRLLMGGRSVLSSRTGPDAFGSLSRYAARLWPQLAHVRWTHGWNGRLAITTDHYPHFHEPAPNVIAALGYNGRGVAMATVMGREIARRVMGTPVGKLDIPVSPIVTIPFHGAWPLGAAARIGLGRIRDAIRI